MEQSEPSILAGRSGHDYCPSWKWRQDCTSTFGYTWEAGMGVMRVHVHLGTLGVHVHVYLKA